MSLSAVLRPMTLDDLDWVTQHEQRQHAFPWSVGNFRDALESGYLALVMEQGDEAVAYAVLMTVLDEAHLLNITVIEGREGQGIGRVFLALLIRSLTSQNVECLFLEVRPSNERARKLYENSGFSLIGRRRGYYPAPNGSREDALVMRLDL